MTCNDLKYIERRVAGEHEDARCLKALAFESYRNVSAEREPDTRLIEQVTKAQDYHQKVLPSSLVDNDHPYRLQRFQWSL